MRVLGKRQQSIDVRLVQAPLLPIHKLEALQLGQCALHSVDGNI
jgi:hypothetical protein